MTSDQREYFLEKRITNKMSSALVHRVEADKLMNFGDQEPSNLPNTNALRVAKCKALKEGRHHNDPVLSVCMMKNMHPYLNIIKDIGYDRFFIHYWSAAEMNVYKQYIKEKKCSIISIDATGSLVKKPLLLSNRKTKQILLYEIAIVDNEINAFTIG